MSAEALINCPLYHLADITPCDPAEIAPLIAHLETDLPVTQPTTFPRGTVLEDGRLDLCKQQLGPEGCRLVTEALATNTTITSLLLGTDGIGDAGAADVARLIACNAHLESVYLGCNKIGKAGVAALAETLTQNGSVQGLWLKRNYIGTEGAHSLAAMLRRNQTLRTLDLVNTLPGLEGLTALVEVLVHENRTVERLYLGGNGIDAEGAALLANLLRTNPMIKALLLNVNDLGDAGTLLLADALRENRTLTELGLASNGITAEGCTALFRAAQTHPTLTHLDLGYSRSTRALGAHPNVLGDSGMEAAGHLLAGNAVLQQFDLRHNRLSETGKAHLLAGLEQNTTLRTLRIDGNPDPHITALLQRNNSFQPVPDLPVTRDVALIRSVYRTIVS